MTTAAHLRDQIPALKIRQRLGRHQWSPPQPWGDDGWMFQSDDRAVLVTLWDLEDDGVDWIHASISRRNGDMPDYQDLKLLHDAVFPSSHAYQCFVPAGEHINITDNVLHLWARVDGERVLPEFGRFGSI